MNADGTLNGNGDVLGFNMFAYCGNNPVMYSDPSGYGKIKDCFNFLKDKFKECYIELCKLSKNNVISKLAKGVGMLNTASSTVTAISNFGDSLNNKEKNIVTFISDVHTICYTGKTATELNFRTPDPDVFYTDSMYQNVCDNRARGYKQQMEIVYGIDVCKLSWDDMSSKEKYSAVQSIREQWGEAVYNALSWGQTDDGVITP